MAELLDWANKHRKATIAIVSISILIFVAVVIWYRSQAFSIVDSGALDSNERALDLAIQANANDLQNWYRSNIIIQSILILAGLSATISAASTNKDNTDVLKKYTVTLTAITSTLAIVLTTFHIRENIETFIRANADLQSIETDYLKDRSSGPIENVLRAKAKDTEKAKAAGKPLGASEEADPPELTALWAKYLPRYLDVEAARLHAWASVGQQSLPAPQRVPQTDTPKPDSGKETKSPEAAAVPPQ